MCDSKLIILNELKRVLETDNSYDDSIISIYDLSKLMRSRYIEYENLIKKNQMYLDEKTHNKIVLCNFNYDKAVLILEVKLDNDDVVKIGVITNDKNDIVFKSNRNFDNVLTSLKKDLITMYNEFMTFYDFMTNQIYFKKTVNSKFEFTVYTACMFICYRNDLGLLDDFDLTYYNKKDIYEDYSNSKEIINLVKGNEDTLYKKIFVKIEDCPKWSRDILYNKRHEQIDKNKVKNLRIN